MDIPEILDLLRNRLVEIQLSRTVVKDTANEEYKRLSEYLHQSKEHDDEFFPFMSMQSMIFRDLQTGEIIRYGYNKSNAEHRLNITAITKNRQYGWLLVEAYEEFEDFLERIYAYIGKSNRNAWHLEDFGSVKLPELNKKPYVWYLETVKKKYGNRHRELLNRIRELYPNLQTLEEKNICQVNLRVAIELIANLRHRIVHTRGIVDDLEVFVERILKNCGLWNNGKPKPELNQFIKMYIQNVAGANTIRLDERRASPTKIPIDTYYDVWNQLIGYLISYAYSISESINPFVNLPGSAPE